MVGAFSRLQLRRKPDSGPESDTGQEESELGTSSSSPPLRLLTLSRVSTSLPLGTKSPVPLLLTSRDSRLACGQTFGFVNRRIAEPRFSDLIISIYSLE